MGEKMKCKTIKIDDRADYELFTDWLGKNLPEEFFDATKHSITDGDDAVLDDVFSYQVYNKLKNHWAGATAPTGVVESMIWYDTDIDRLFYRDGARVDIEL